MKISIESTFITFTLSLDKSEFIDMNILNKDLSIYSTLKVIDLNINFDQDEFLIKFSGAPDEMKDFLGNLGYMIHEIEDLISNHQ
jgi:hypothetical protein